MPWNEKFGRLAATGLLVAAFSNAAGAQPAGNAAGQDLIIEPLPATVLKDRPHDMFRDQDGNRLVYLPSNGAIQAAHLASVLPNDPKASALTPGQLPPPADIGNGWYFAPAGSNIFHEVQSSGGQMLPSRNFNVQLSVSNGLFMISPTLGFRDTVNLRNDGYFDEGAHFKAYQNDGPIDHQAVHPLEGMCNKGVVQFSPVSPANYDMKDFTFYNIKNSKNLQDRGILDLPICESKNLIWRQAPAAEKAVNMNTPNP